MLVLIRVTPPMTTTTRRRQQRGTEADRRRHKKVHRCRQQKNSYDNKTPTMRQSQDANNDDGIPTTTTNTGRQR